MSTVVVTYEDGSEPEVVPVYEPSERDDHEVEHDSVLLSDGDLLDKLSDYLATHRRCTDNPETIIQEILYLANRVILRSASLTCAQGFPVRSDQYIRSARLAMRKTLAQL